MEIMGYMVANQFKVNSFVVSIYNQIQEGKELLLKQKEAIENILEIELDFFDFEFTLPENHEYYIRFNELRLKLYKNNFRKVKPKNNCIRAIQSIINDEPRLDLINQVLYPEDYYGRRR